MRLSDVVAGMNLAIFPIIALCAFGSVFIVATLRALLTDRKNCDRWAHLPLENGGENAAQQEEAA